MALNFELFFLIFATIIGETFIITKVPSLEPRRKIEQ